MVIPLMKPEDSGSNPVLGNHLSTFTYLVLTVKTNSNEEKETDIGPI